MCIINENQFEEMRQETQLGEVSAANQRSLSTLSRAINLSSGNFALILVRCNYEATKKQMWRGLQELTNKRLSAIVLQDSIKTLYNHFAILNGEQTSAVVVFGLESVTAIDQTLISTNQLRDEFRKSLTCPLVLWVTDEVLQKLTRFAPDFKSWAATSIKFELATEHLLALWNQTAYELFTTILAQDIGGFLCNTAFNLAPGCRRRQELEAALRDLHLRDVSLEPALVATWQFILGRDAYCEEHIDVAIEQYQKSLEFWQQQVSRREGEGKIRQIISSASSLSDLLPSSLLERVGIILHHISLCYCKQAKLQPTESRRHWEQARTSLSASIEMFEAASRSDWVAQLTMQLGEVLQHLESWSDLQALAQHSLDVPEIQNNPVLLAQTYGFLGAVAVAFGNWVSAKELASISLDIGKQCSLPRRDHLGWYLLLKAKAQRQLGDSLGSIADLQQAINQEINFETLLPSSLEQQPQLYLDILEELRSLYLEQGQYLRAFELKQEQSLIAQQHGFCTFIGATPLLTWAPGKEISLLEIAAAGRQPDVNRLIERLSRNDHKLTVIHGPSGVGKSSLINAGLLPALKARTIAARESLTIVQKVYTDWIGELGRLLSEKLSHWQIDKGIENATTEKSFQLNSLENILQQLRLSAERNLLTVLIFDQFEEFFFLNQNFTTRRQFYVFLEQCLNLPFVKIVLSLREDYLHYLLECERYNNFTAINNNILDKQLRYYLGDLSSKDAKNVLVSLSAGSQFQLEDPLIDLLVQDLSRNSGAVRLIELQVVGAQLQAEKITTTQQYFALGSSPITALIERSIFNTIEDCGKENEDTVWQILFSLTDEKNTRPLKAYKELLREELLEQLYRIQPKISRWQNTENIQLQAFKTKVIAQKEKLNLILKILIGSGLVLRVSEEAQTRYQLVHDYLVKPIRRNYEKHAHLKFSAKLESKEIQLLQIRKQRWRALAIGITMSVLAITTGILGIRTEVERKLATKLSINSQLSAISASSEALFVSNKKFDALLEALRAAQQLKNVETLSNSSQKVEPDTRLQVITALQQAVYGALERNRLEGHSDVVWGVSFSPDNQLIASASRDKTVKLWRHNGSLVTTINGHEDSVTSVTFSPDSQLIASASWDGTVRLWLRNGKLVRILRGHVGNVYSVSFSPDGQKIASVGNDRTIRIWTVDGKLIETLRGHEGFIQSVSFSPDGETIASASEDKTIKLWTTQGKLLKTLTGHEGKVNCVVFSPDGKFIASASDDRTVKLWKRNGELIRTFPKHQRWVFGVAFSADSKLIASASADNTVKLWNLNGAAVKTLTGHSHSVTAVSFNPVFRKTKNTNLNSNQLLIASASLDKTIKLWTVDEEPAIMLSHQAEVRDVTFSPDSQLIATASNDNTVKIWNRSGELLRILRGHSARVSSISFSPDSTTIASASRDGTVRLWNLRSTAIESLKLDGLGVLNVSFSPDSQRIFGASRDGTVKVWNRQGTLIQALIKHTKPVNAVTVSADGQRIASASDDYTVKLWSSDGTLLKTLRGHTNWVLDVSFSPDSQILASASYDNTVKLWNRDGELIKTLKGHTDSLTHVRFSPTGKVLATSTWENRIQLWRLDDTLIKTLEGHTERVTNLSWSNDGKTLASASHDQTVIIWNLDLDDLLEKSCNLMQDYLQTNPRVRQSDRLLCQSREKAKKLS